MVSRIILIASLSLGFLISTAPWAFASTPDNFSIQGRPNTDAQSSEGLATPNTQYDDWYDPYNSDSEYPSFANDQDSEYPPSIDAQNPEPPSAADKAQLVIINIPNLRWNSLDPLECPTLYKLADNSAIANMSAPWNNLGDSIASEEMIELLCLDPDLTLEQSDAAVADTLALVNEKQVVAIVSAAVFSDAQASQELTPIIIKGEGFSGLLTSESTQRVGLVYGEDLILLGRYLAAKNAELEVNLLKKPTPLQEVITSNTPPVLTCDLSPATVEARIAQLENSMATFEAIRQSKTPISLVYMVFVYLTFGFSAWLMIAKQTDKREPSQIMVQVIQILWIITLSYPAATFLMSLTLPLNPDPWSLMFVCGVWVVAIAVAAYLIGRRTRQVNSLLFLFLTSIALIAIGQIFGGPLQEPGYLTYDITEGSRFYGMGNEQAAIFFGSWYAFSGLLLNNNKDSLALTAFRQWGFLIGSAVLLFIAACPWFGASFGPLVWASFGSLAIWWVFNGRHIKLWHVITALAISAMLAIGILIVDVLANPYSHMAGYRSALDEGLLTMLIQILLSGWQNSLQTTINHMPLIAILCFVAIVVVLVLFRVSKKIGLKEFWVNNRAYSAVYTVSLAIALIIFLTEDSGLFTPAIFMTFAVSGFVWLAFDKRLSEEKTTAKCLLLNSHRESFEGANL
ncbi:MAG: hypothetical protein LBU61_02570 [Coriobacteriales bacterium]|jgi:hypothetical protein|nr:hypothetical protein [Coriobacteriales bacterium]